MPLSEAYLISHRLWGWGKVSAALQGQPYLSETGDPPHVRPGYGHAQNVIQYLQSANGHFYTHDFFTSSFCLRPSNKTSEALPWGGAGGGVGGLRSLVPTDEESVSDSCPQGGSEANMHSPLRIFSLWPDSSM